MRRSNAIRQADLFNNVPAPPAITTLQLHHDELVGLIGNLLREVVQVPKVMASKENSHEQDQR